MKNAKLKLMAAFASLLMAMILIVGVSYAWLTLSDNPVSGNISIAIGGGNTILLAEDITEVVTDEDGEDVTVHYPAEFSSELEFSESNYAYLSEIYGLTPVSTSDGISWFVSSDEGDESLGEEYSDLVLDRSLEYANSETEGGYVYMDFWIVSPVSDCKIRVSMDVEDESGSYVVAESEDEISADVVASSLRVGFLVNLDSAPEAALEAYEASSGYSDNYDSLAGVYSEKGEEPALWSLNAFAIYEPNADLHASEYLTGYQITTPLAYNAFTQEVSEADISDILMIQLESSINSDGTVTSGRFITSTEALFARLDAYTDEEAVLESIDTSGASEDTVIVTLDKNVPQRIRMFIWIEGCDADCEGSQTVSASSVRITIELAGEN